MITLKKLLAIAALATAAAIMPSCEKEDNAPETTSKQSIIDYDGKSPIVYNGKTMEWHFQEPKKHLSKGYLKDELDVDYYDYQYAYYKKDTTYKYRTMKVHKRNDTSKYFYVMIDNLDIAPSKDCYAYNDDESLVPTYGRLYEWEKADELKSQIYMVLPIYKKNGKISSQYHKTPAKLMTMEHIMDILESDHIGNLPENGFQITNDNYNADSYCYYDAFVFGPDYTDYTEDAHHSLGGSRAPDWLKHTEKYTQLNMVGSYWLNEVPHVLSPELHYPLTITRQYRDYSPIYEWAAYINASVSNENGCSVRYVFEPEYMTR